MINPRGIDQAGEVHVEVIRKKDEMRRIVERAKARGGTVGVVPTMGYFHDGHLELMRRAVSDCDLVVVTLFVNPAQFAPGEDLASYPSDFERDSLLAGEVGVDYVFAPEVEEMYPGVSSTAVEVRELSRVMCGLFRPLSGSNRSVRMPNGVAVSSTAAASTIRRLLRM